MDAARPLRAAARGLIDLEAAGSAALLRVPGRHAPAQIGRRCRRSGSNADGDRAQQDRARVAEVPQPAAVPGAARVVYGEVEAQQGGVEEDAQAHREAAEGRPARAAQRAAAGEGGAHRTSRLGLEALEVRDEGTTGSVLCADLRVSVQRRARTCPPQRGARCQAIARHLDASDAGVGDVCRVRLADGDPRRASFRLAAHTDGDPLLELPTREQQKVDQRPAQAAVGPARQRGRLRGQQPAVGAHHRELRRVVQDAWCERDTGAHRLRVRWLRRLAQQPEGAELLGLHATNRLVCPPRSWRALGTPLWSAAACRRFGGRGGGERSGSHPIRLHPKAVASHRTP
jgi:hypothetical protein